MEREFVQPILTNERPAELAPVLKKKMRSDRIKIGEIGVDIENHLKYS